MNGFQHEIQHGNFYLKVKPKSFKRNKKETEPENDEIGYVSVIL